MIGLTRKRVIAVLQQNYQNIAALEPLAEREPRLPWHGIVADAVHQPLSSKNIMKLLSSPRAPRR